MKVSDLRESEYNAYYKTYISKVLKEMTLIEGFENGQNQITSFFKSISDNKLEYSYEPNKWNVKEVFQHIIDTERIFIYRCFRIARHDKTFLSGFEQDDYVKPSNANKKSIHFLLEEYNTVRQNSIGLLKSLTEQDLKFIGNASENPMSARAAAFIILGHEIHHVNVIRERYL